MTTLAFAALAILPALAVIAALYDLTSMTIPNWLTAALAVAFAPAALAVGLPWESVGLHLGVGAGALALGVGLFAMGWLGGGDAKLLAASALWLGWPGAMMLVMWTAVGGGFLALGLISARKAAPMLPIGRAPGWVGRLMEPKGDIPYGLAIAFGVLAVFPTCDMVGRLPSM